MFTKRGVIPGVGHASRSKITLPHSAENALSPPTLLPQTTALVLIGKFLHRREMKPRQPLCSTASKALGNGKPNSKIHLGKRIAVN